MKYVSRVPSLLFLALVVSCGNEELAKDTVRENASEGLMCGGDLEHQEYVLGGTKWTNVNLSYSFMPDGTTTGTATSTLYSEMGTHMAEAVWKKEIAKALSRWASVTPLNFFNVDDGGQASSVTGVPQADNRFGDIRIAAAPLTGSTVASTSQPGSQTATNTYGGNMTFAVLYDWYQNQNIHLMSYALHESGHSIGLAHSTSGTIMYSQLPWYNGVPPQLAADDIAGAQALYGARVNDAYDLASNNGAIATASTIALNAAGRKFIDADVLDNNDIDYYRVVIPAGAGPVLSITAENGRSLLTVRISLFDVSGNLLHEVSAADYSQGTLLQYGNVAEGEEYFIGVDSPVEDEFGHGMYRLAVEFRGSIDGIAYVPPARLSPDNKEMNDSLAAANDLGQFSSKSVTGLKIHWAWDEDYFAMKTANGSSRPYRVSLTYTTSSDPLEIEIFNSSGTKIASSNGASSVTFNTSSSTNYKVRIYSPTRLPRGYDLSIARQ